MIWKIPLTDVQLGEEEIDAVARVLRGKWLCMGPVTEEFESAFARRVGVKHAIAVCNCTAALHLANLALGIGIGDEVVCPSLTFVATSNAIRYVGATPILIDPVSRDDLTIDPAKVEAAITPRTKAIVVVHYAGFSCRMDELKDVASRYGLRIVEDCAHALFTTHRFRDGSTAIAGSMGDIGCFSFFANKNMTTGEGGMLVTGDDDLAKRLRLLRSHGMTSLTYDRHKGHASGYDVAEVGYNYRLDEIRSAIGLVQLGRLDEGNAARRKVWTEYARHFQGSSVFHVPFKERNLAHSSCHILPLVCDIPTAPLREHLTRKGIQTSRHYESIRRFTAYGCNPDEGFIGDSIMTLPLGPLTTSSQIEEVVSSIGEMHGL